MSEENNIIDFEASLTGKQVEKIGGPRLQENSVRARMMLVMMSKSKKELMEIFAKADEDFLLETVKQFEELTEFLENLHDISKSAFARVMCVGEEIIDQRNAA